VSYLAGLPSEPERGLDIGSAGTNVGEATEYGLRDGVLPVRWDVQIEIQKAVLATIGRSRVGARLSDVVAVEDLNGAAIRSQIVIGVLLRAHLATRAIPDDALDVYSAWVWKVLCSSSVLLWCWNWSRSNECCKEGEVKCLEEHFV
jgi:hypothetical protein